MNDPEFRFDVIEEVDIFNFNTPDNENLSLNYCLTLISNVLPTMDNN